MAKPNGVLGEIGKFSQKGVIVSKCSLKFFNGQVISMLVFLTDAYLIVNDYDF
jgi:hypothetical protein